MKSLANLSKPIVVDTIMEPPFHEKLVAVLVVVVEWGVVEWVGNICSLGHHIYIIRTSSPIHVALQFILWDILRST